MLNLCMEENVYRDQHQGEGKLHLLVRLRPELHPGPACGQGNTGAGMEGYLGGSGKRIPQEDSKRPGG